MSRVASALAWAALGLLVGGCSGPLLAYEVLAPTRTPSARPEASSARPEASPLADPRPLRFPRDHGPHARLTEWWYYSGHLGSEDARRFGFEYVIFRAQRDGFPVAWVSHLALTDETGERFAYDQRWEIGDRVDRSEPDEGFDLAITGDVIPGVRLLGPAWTMIGGLGSDRLDAESGRSGQGLELGLTLDLRDDREPLLHDDIVYVGSSPPASSSYYSRPRMAASGSITLGDEVIPVSGSAWFDHQWGDFIVVGGWDWFAVNLHDGTDLMVWVMRDPDGRDALVSGTIRDDQEPRRLGGDEIVVEAQGEWTSPQTAATWPAGWRLEIPGEGLRLDLRPTVAGQELDARATTGLVYWEGSQVVTAERDGVPLGGEAYVELTGYGPGPEGER